MSDRPALVAQSTLPHGPQEVTVGATVYNVPKGAGVAQGPSGLTYVLHAAKVYCLSERGEISIPPRVRGTLASHYFGANQRKQAPVETTPTS